MRVTPITPTHLSANPPKRAMMIIHHKDHIVITDTEERFSLPPEQAWELHQAINGGVIA